MMPFLCDDLLQLMKSLLNRFIKADVVRENSTAFKSVNLDVSDKKLNCESKKIDLGFSAENEIKRLKGKKAISERQEFELRVFFKEGLIKIVKKLQEKSRLKQTIVRNMKCFDPCDMLSNKDSCKDKLKRLLKLLMDSKRFQETNCDDILAEFTEFLEECVPKVPSTYRDFDARNPVNRIDVLLKNEMKPYQHLSKVMTLLMLLSHGQASVERRFSVNKEIVVENLNEETFVSLRTICDHINTVGGINNVEITKSLVLAAGSARQRYMAYLDEARQAKVTEEKNRRRKSTLEKIDDLKEKKRRLSKDIESMRKTSEKFADKAESTGQVTWIAKSNSLRRSAQDKVVEQENTDKRLNELLKALAS